MAARDGAASVQGEVLRVTPLTIDGAIDDTKPILTTSGFISASFNTDIEDGDEITEKAANGKICIQYKADDSLKGITFNLSLCVPDPEATALIAGGQVILETSDPDAPVIGYSSPAVGASVGNPVAIEIWSKAIVNGKPAPGTPYWHWVFPYVRVRYDGDREFSNGALANDYSGTGVGNDALVTEGLNPDNVDDDFVTYRTALVNPFSYVRTADLPAAGWSTPSWPGSGIVPSSGIVAAGATPGTPGTWTPTGADPPANLITLQGMGALGQTVAWTIGQYNVLGDASHAFWNGSGWVSGQAAVMEGDDAGTQSQGSQPRQSRGRES